jgi:lipid-binding SYLF domain-containing protein
VKFPHVIGSGSINHDKKKVMKKIKLIIATLAVSALVLLPRALNAQDKDIKQDSKEAKVAFLKSDASMQRLFDNSYAYAIFPNVGKGAVVVGGAGGNGIVYHHGKIIGQANMVQATVGAQAGGEAYREVIFFENKDALDRFKDNKVEFSGQVSAVVVKSGASANVKYREGVSVFTEEKGGLMAEASVGGQKFTYKSLE